MALFVDFVGLNTLIQEPINLQTNTVGDAVNSTPSASVAGGVPNGEVRNTQILTIEEGSYLAALNAHRNGPYGFSTFKQLRSSENPIIRRHKLDNTFSYYRTPGKRIAILNGKERSVFNERRSDLEHYSEVPVVSKHKPLRMLGSVTTMDEKTKQDRLEPVQVFATLGNQTQYFSNKPINEYFDVDEILDNDYENFIDLYLEGGIDGDESPIDEFRLLTYRQVVYPKELYTYKNHTRNRINFVSRYWRDERTNRTEILVDNGFGFNIISQSAWVLDAEQDFKNLSYEITPGTITLVHPNKLLSSIALVASSSQTQVSSGVPAYTFPNNGTGTGQKSFILSSLNDRRIPPTGDGQADLIRGYGGWPSTTRGLTYVTQIDQAQKSISTNPYDLSIGSLHDFGFNTGTPGLNDLLTTTGFVVDREQTNGYVTFKRKNTGAPDDPMGLYFEGSTTLSDRNEWRLKTTSSCLSVWLAPPQRAPAAFSNTNYQESFLSGTIYHEWVNVTASGGASYEKKLSKIVSIDPKDNGNLIVRLGTVFTSSADDSLVYIGANETGSVEYRTTNFYGVDNPIYKAASAFNDSLTLPADSGKASRIAATHTNHLFVEFDLSGSEPALGLGHSLNSANRKSRGALFRQKNSSAATNYARVYVNASASNIHGQAYTAGDPYSFLSGAAGNFQNQIKDGNTSLKLGAISSQRSSYYLNNSAYTSINPFSSTGFSFSYWIRFNDAGAVSGDNNHIFTILDESAQEAIDHTYDHGSNTLKVGFKGSYTTTNQRLYSAEYANGGAGFETDTWYNVVFTAMTGSTNMTFDMQLFKKGQSTAETLTNKGLVTTNYAATLSNSDFATTKGSKQIVVLAAGGTATLIRTPGATANTTFDNVNIDDLTFFNGGLQPHQMTQLASGSANTNASGLAGDAARTPVVSDYPATDITTAIMATSNQAATMVHNRRTFELNTHRSTIDTLRTGQASNKGDVYFPLGSNYGAGSFQTNILNTGVSGELDLSFWFKPTHENYRNRALNWPHNASDYTSGAKVQTFSRITKRSETPKGFFISWWMKRNEDFHSTEFLPILQDENDLWGVGFGPNTFYAGKPNRELTFWLRGANGETRYWHGGQKLATSDHDWHFCSVQWNGRTGAEAAVSFQIDADAPDIEYYGRMGGALFMTNPSDREDFAVMSTGGSNIDVLNARDLGATIYPFRLGSSTKDVSIAHLTIIQEPTAPSQFNNIRDLLYNSGQYKDISDTDLTTALVNERLTYTNETSLQNHVTTYRPLLYEITKAAVNNAKARINLCATNPTYYRQYFQATGVTVTPELHAAAGGYTFSFVFGNTGGASYWKPSGSPYTRSILHAIDSSNNSILKLYTNNSSNLNCAFNFPDGKGGSVYFTNATDTLFDGLPHDVLLTWNGGTNGAGDPIDLKLYIDGVQQTRVNIASNADSNRRIGNLGQIDKFIIGGSLNSSGNFDLTYAPIGDFYLDRVKLFNQYWGSNTTGWSALRSTLRYISDHANYYDITWKRTENLSTTYSVAASSYSSGLTSVTINPPAIDCSISERQGDMTAAQKQGGTVSGNFTNVIRLTNRAEKSPVIIQQWKLGSEPELRKQPIHSFFQGPSETVALESSGANPEQFYVGSKTKMVSASRHWNIDWINADGRVDVNGQELPVPSIGYDQTLFVCSDSPNPTSAGQRTFVDGVELFLSSSGGGYQLVSGVGTTGFGAQSFIDVSSDDLIVPNKWYHVYASYSGLAAGGTPSLKMYINGKEVTMTNTQGTGTFNPQAASNVTAINNNGQRPMIGGVKNNAGTHRSFSGFIQDVAIWNRRATNNGRDRAIGCLDLWDGMRNGSDYIDLSDTNLQIALKTGFYAGATVESRMTKVNTGGQTVVGSSFAGTDVANAYVTGPPIGIFFNGPAGSSADPMDDRGATVISFWAKIDAGTAIQRIISFNSDAAYNSKQVEADQGRLNGVLIHSPTDSTGVPNDNKLTRLSIDLERNGNSGIDAHINRAAIKSGADVSYTDDAYTKQNVTHTITEVDLTQLNHFVFIVTKDRAHIYFNGAFVTSAGSSASTYDTKTIQPDAIYDLNNGWNAITVLSEDLPLLQQGVLDELAVLFYKEADITSASQRLDIATSLYNNGSVYDYSNKATNLYAWWRMGEASAGSPISVGTLLGSNTKIDDSSGHPTSVQNNLYVPFANRFQAITRTSQGNSDLKNYYNFNVPDANNPNIPKAANITPTGGNDSISGKTLSFNGQLGSFWSPDYSYDSYELHPFNWLASEGEMTETVFCGQSDTLGLSFLKAQSTAFGGNGGTPDQTEHIADPAIFAGASTSNDKTRAKTVVVFRMMPSDIEEILIHRNPRNIASGAMKSVFAIRFDSSVVPGASDTSFSTNQATIGTSGASIADITDRIKTLLDHSTGLNSATYTTTRSTTSAANDTITVEVDPSKAGKNGAYEIIFAPQSNLELLTVSIAIGHPHIAKALTKSPNFSWVRADDSDFSRLSIPTSVSTKGLHKDGAGVVKPYWYQHFSLFSDASSFAGSPILNIGLSAGKYNIIGANTANINHLGNYGSRGESLVSSGSSVTLTLRNSPTLDFNNITMHTSSLFQYVNNSSLFPFTTPGAPQSLVGGSTGARARFGPGILQNNYNQFAQEIVEGPTQTIDPQLSASACYFRRHSLTASTSFVSPNGGFLHKLSASHNLDSASTALVGNMSASHLFLGSAKWEAGDFAGYFTDSGDFVNKPKKPFYDTYQSFISDARPIMKDYGIVPEFKISDHVNDYLTKGPTEQKLNFLNITGGLASADSSEKQDFYEIYSTTDFLKHFKIVQEDHSDFVDPYAIRLKCSVVKKFLPYEGFYPAQRSVQVAQQFYDSYAGNINITAASPHQYDLTQDKEYGIQYLLNPLFSPGILFNTIKSGVAVDYPLITDTGSVEKIIGGNDGGAMITQQFDTRVPFEALIEPEKHLANITLAGNEPDPNGDTGIQIEWGGQGDQLYNMMVSNFLAETSEFFLENKSFTSLSSLSQGDANFGNAQKGNVYMMRLKMFRTTRGNKPVAKNYLSKSYGVPQDQGDMTESFTMYSRPSAFGPPQYLSGSGFTARTWSDFKFDGTSGSVFVEDSQSPVFDLKALPFQHDFSYVTGATYGAPYGGSSTASGSIGNEAHKGYNYPFTPPYYHGEAWADITFIPKETKKYSLQEIINQSSVEFYRYFAGSGSIGLDGYTIEGDPAMRIHLDGGRSTLSHVHDRTVVINDQAMQIASSVNIFSQGVLEQDISAQGASGIGSTTNVQVDTNIENKYRWIIQTKFETPMLNFNHYTYGKHTNQSARDEYVAKTDGTNVAGAGTLPLYTDSTYGIELPGVGPMQTPIGMWHQYGHIPQNSKEGVFLQVDDVPTSWIANAMLKPKPIASRYKSLANLCGFSTDPVRMGEVAGVKEISEAVVAIPFFESGGTKRFFTMDRQQIEFAQDPSKVNLVGRTIVNMVDKMKKFVIPPSLDFVANPQIKPFSMYIFEFRHNLTKQDLADIWQNLPPELNETVQTDEVSVSHQLLAYELLGRGGNYKKGERSELELERNDRLNSINPEIRWMVFKVKQRAKTSYFEKIFARNESQQLLSQRLKLGVTADTLGRKNKISYNWPYDFFSMIEGVKLETEVHFLDIDETETKEQEKPVVKPKVKEPPAQTEGGNKTTQTNLQAVSGLVTPQVLKTSEPVNTNITKKRAGKINRQRRVTKASPFRSIKKE